MPDLTLDVRRGSLDTTSMRYHELSLQKWLYSHFFLRQGYPVPVIFGMPMDAFSTFNKLWSQANNPFLYLLDIKDASGTPLYEPYPSPLRYPLISVMRQGIKYRPYQNFSIHRWRHLNWPTVSDTGAPIPGVPNTGTGLLKSDLGNVTTSRMPMAFDYRFQIDHLCLRPDTQSFFVEKLINQFWRTGGSLQSWMTVVYPGWGPHYVRIYLEGDIDQKAPDENSVDGHNVEFRTTFTLVIEGFSIDLDYKIEPTLWTILYGPGSPDQLDNLLLPVFTTDLRTYGTNLVLDSRPDIPPYGEFAQQQVIQTYVAAGTAYISGGDPSVGTIPGGNLINPQQTLIQTTDAIAQVPQYSYGIASSVVFGTHVFTGTSI